MCDGKEGSQCEENFSLILNLNLNKKTLPWEYSGCGKIFMHHSPHYMYIKCQTGHKPYEYQNYGEKPYKYMWKSLQLSPVL